LTPGNGIALAAILAMVGIAIWQAFRAQAKSDAKAQWAKIADLERRVQHLETLVAVLKKAMEAMPTRDDLRDRLEALAERMEGRLEALGQTLHATLIEMSKKGARP
jgi:hypothetical protein